MAVVAKVCRAGVTRIASSEKKSKVKSLVTIAAQTLWVLSTQTWRCSQSIEFTVVLHCPQLLTSCWGFCGTH